jgi:hypothetical protein
LGLDGSAGILWVGGVSAGSIISTPNDFLVKTVVVPIFILIMELSQIISQSTGDCPYTNFTRAAGTQGPRAIIRRRARSKNIVHEDNAFAI